MENNFNLRKFLTENKLTVSSKQIKEGGYDYTEQIGNIYQDAIEDYLNIAGKSYRDNKELYKTADNIYNGMYNDGHMEEPVDSDTAYEEVESWVSANMPDLAENRIDTDDLENTTSNDDAYSKAFDTFMDKDSIDKFYDTLLEELEKSESKRKK